MRPVMEQKRRLIPPAYLLLALIAEALLHRFWPIQRIIETPYTYLGVIALLAGIVMTGSAARLFKTAGTPVVPFERSTALVTSGVYRFTRNPMYLGLILILLGVAIWLGTLSAFLPVPVFVWIIQRNFVRGEERFLEDIFGDEYVAYKRSVRRWL
jgi:protein-S-isoprenylcysteine O-methyltransferase Ste14